MPTSILAHIVTYNSPDCVFACIDSLISQSLSQNIKIIVTDNASSVSPLPRIQERYGKRVVIRQNQQNLGFCGAHNQGAFLCLKEGHDYLLVMNPDVKLNDDALQILISERADNQRIGLYTPKLLRADENLQAFKPAIIDAAGMVLTSSLRHFDRGSENQDQGQYENSEFVFGGTGACLLLTRSFIEDASINADSLEGDVDLLYPQLSENRQEREQLFDEAFFAYREDADLAWRAKTLGWKCRYVPKAIGYHRRVVTPARRTSLSPELNLLSVKNRFLLQLNNYSLRKNVAAFIPGIIIRNLIVIAGVLLREKSSLPAFSQILKVYRRALARRNKVFRKQKNTPQALATWNSQASRSS